MRQDNFIMLWSILSMEFIKVVVVQTLSFQEHTAGMCTQVSIAQHLPTQNSYTPCSTTGGSRKGTATMMHCRQQRKPNRTQNSCVTS